VLTYEVSDLRAGMYILEATGTTQRTTLRLNVQGGVFEALMVL